MKEWIDSAAKTVGIGAAAALCFSFVYNVAYFAALGSLNSMQVLTIADYLTSAIQTIPFLLVAGIFALVAVEWRKIFKLKPPPATEKQAKNQYALVLVVFLLIFLLALLALLGIWFLIIFVVLTLLLLLASLIIQRTVPETMGGRAIGVFAFPFGAFMFAFLMGFGAGEGDCRNDREPNDFHEGCKAVSRHWRLYGRAWDFADSRQDSATSVYSA